MLNRVRELLTYEQMKHELLQFSRQPELVLLKVEKMTLVQRTDRRESLASLRQSLERNLEKQLETLKSPTVTSAMAVMMQRPMIPA